ncbi:immunity repressor [Gordonia phage Culver]|nr:immunity repressor [Gordonia phage WilliamBoone]WNM66358.1 immunity repressor [Gordonia phage Culver]
MHETLISVMQRNNEVPQPWHKAMLKQGLTNPRTGEPSYNALAKEAGLHTTTVVRLITGRADPRLVEKQTLERVAEALSVPLKKVTEWLGESWDATAPPYAPPTGSEVLTSRQRKVLDDLIRTFISDVKYGPGNEDSNPRLA